MENNHSLRSLDKQQHFRNKSRLCQTLLLDGIDSIIGEPVWDSPNHYDARKANIIVAK